MTPEQHIPQQAAPYPDEIDLVELLAAIWRQRLWMAGGLVAGAVVALGYWVAVPGGFQSSVPVTLDTTSLPALSEPKRVEEAFNSALGARENARVFFDAVLKAFPALGTESERREMVYNLVDSQVPPEAGKKRSGKLGVKFSYVAGLGDFEAELVLPIRGANDTLGSAVVAGLNAVTEQYNKTNLELRLSDARSTQKESLEALRQEQTNRTINTSGVTQEQMRVRGEISAMVAKLQKRAPGVMPREGNLFAPMMFTSQGAGQEGNSGYTMVQPDYVEERLDILRASRLIGILQDSGNLSREDATNLEAKLGELSRRSMDLEAGSRAQAGMRQALLERISQARLRMATTKSPDDLPLMRGDEAMLKDLHKRGRFEQRSQSVKLLLLGGGFLGLFAGLFLGLGVSFVRHNKKRLALLSQQRDVES